MWSSFWISCLALAILLFLPGYVLLRNAQFEHVVAFAAAPLLTVSYFAVLSIIYGFFSVSCSPTSIVTPLILFTALGTIFGVIKKRADNPLRLTKAEPLYIADISIPFEPAILLLYIFIGIAVVAIFFVGNLYSPEAFYVRWDNQTHLNLTKSYLDSGIWSSLLHSLYLSAPESGIPTPNHVSFYPAAWHDLVALVSSLTNVPVTTACNVVNFVEVAIVYPAGLFLFLKALFPKLKVAIASGAILSLAIATMPWSLFRKGPLFPNLLSFILMISALGLLLLFIQDDAIKRKPIIFAVMGVSALIAIALSQPNALFAMIVFLVPFSMHIAGSHIDSKKDTTPEKKRQKKAVAWFTIAGAALSLWLIALNFPPLQSVVQYPIASTHSKKWAVFRILALLFPPFFAEPFISLFALMGIYTCIKNRHFWLLFAPLFFALAYFFSRWGHAPLFCRFFAGFWYSDFTRLSTLLAIFVIPVAALGVETIVSIFATFLAKVFSHRIRPVVSVACIMSLLVFVCYIPGVSFDIDQAKKTVALSFSYANTENVLSTIYNTDGMGIYTAEERIFVEKAAQLTNNELVLNCPYDGSSLSYGVDGLNTYFRNARGQHSEGGESSEFTEEARLIREGLYRYANSKEIRNAVKRTGAQYLLLLDQNVSFKDGVWFTQYTEEQTEEWVGITSVRDDTIGFDTVLKDGDMRLYRLTLLEG